MAKRRSVIKKGSRDSRAIAKRMMSLETMQEKAWEAMQKAVQGVVEQHKKTGRPRAVWKKGKVAGISPFR